MGIKQRLKDNPTIYKFYIFFYGIRRLLRCIKYANQSDESKIYQISHRLERGLCLDKKHYKNRWGFRKANELVELISKQMINDNNDSVIVGCSVLAAFIKEKEEMKYEDELDDLHKLKERINNCGLKIKIDDKWGGILHLQKDDLLIDDSLLGKIMNRHSCRDYSTEPVAIETIKKAVKAANKAPSSCNRQATDVYVIDATARKKITGENIMGADKYLIICGRMDSFGTHEIDDWLVSSGIFCGYLSMALHAVGVGSVFMRKELIGKSGYNNSIRKICGIPDSQEIIIEMGIGNYCNDFFVPVSRRKNVDEILHFNV